MNRKVERKHSKKTFMSSFVGFFGILYSIAGVAVISVGFLLFITPIGNMMPENIFENLGLSVSISFIVLGMILFLNGALFIALTETVRLSKQNNEMLKDIISK